MTATAQIQDVFDIAKAGQQLAMKMAFESVFSIPEDVSISSLHHRLSTDDFDYFGKLPQRSDSYTHLIPLNQTALFNELPQLVGSTCYFMQQYIEQIKFGRAYASALAVKMVLNQYSYVPIREEKAGVLKALVYTDIIESWGIRPQYKNLTTKQILEMACWAIRSHSRNIDKLFKNVSANIVVV